MHPSVATALPGFLKQYEGKVNFMYLDVKGLVTIGIGNLIDPVNLALKLEFGTKGGGGPVSGGDVISEWNTVKARTDLMGKGSAGFGAITRLQLTDKGIETMVNDHAKAIESYITTNASAQKYYSNFPNWPADAQMALIGIAWGVMPLPQFGWHKFPEACKIEDWETAANECKITSAIATGRNEAHKLMFLNAAAVKANGDPISQLCWPTRQGRTVKPDEGNLW
jgi:hypothetical protein